MATIGEGLPKGLQDMDAYLPAEGGQPGFATPPTETGPIPSGITTDSMSMPTTPAPTRTAPFPSGLDDPSNDYTPDADVDVGIAADPYWGSGAVGGAGSVGEQRNNRTSLFGGSAENVSDAADE